MGRAQLRNEWVVSEFQARTRDSVYRIGPKLGEAVDTTAVAFKYVLLLPLSLFFHPPPYGILARRRYGRVVSEASEIAMTGDSYEPSIGNTFIGPLFVSLTTVLPEARQASNLLIASAPSSVEREIKP